MRASVRSARITASLAVEPGTITAVVGPNGAGKTSLLRALAGLDASEGGVEVAGRAVAGLPAHERGIGWLPQGTTLFPHLPVIDNAAYALRCRGVRRGLARERAAGWLDRLGVQDLADRRPSTLSGGQAARVALARALAAEPALLLLDEPLAALDVDTREEVRRVLRHVLVGGPAAVLVVTHDPIDVVALADRVLVLEGGAVVQDATVTEVTTAPTSTWAAALLGLNAWSGVTTSTGLQVGDGHITVAEPRDADQPALAVCEPSAVTLHRTAPSGSARTVLSGPVLETRALGGRVRVTVGSHPPVVAEVTAAAAAELDLSGGGSVWAAVKATEVRLVSLGPLPLGSGP